jgi:hypothetical protein
VGPGNSTAVGPVGSPSITADSFTPFRNVTIDAGATAQS